jgi:hypothetical protein
MVTTGRPVCRQRNGIDSVQTQITWSFCICVGRTGPIIIDSILSYVLATTLHMLFSAFAREFLSPASGRNIRREDSHSVRGGRNIRRRCGPTTLFRAPPQEAATLARTSILVYPIAPSQTHQYHTPSLPPAPLRISIFTPLSLTSLHQLGSLHDLVTVSPFWHTF